jgi:Ser/Thr protein kinase RdoA (MazF antagonist)
MTKSLAKRVLQYYPLTLYQVIPYPSLYLIQTDQGWKRLIKWESLSDLLRALKIREYAEKNGFNRFTAFTLTKEGEAYVQMADGFFMLTDWPVGHMPDIRKGLDAWEIGETLARLHRSIAGYQDEVAGTPYNHWAYRFQQSQYHFQQFYLNVHAFPSPVRNLLLKNSAALMQRIQASRHLLEKGRYEWHRRKGIAERLWCHGKFVPTVLRFDREMTLRVFQMQSGRKDLPLYDVARLIRYAVLQQVGQQALFSFLDGYHSSLPLPKEAGVLLQAYLIFPHAVWKSLHQIIIEGHQVPEHWEKTLCQHFYQMEAAEGCARSLSAWFERHAAD